MSQQTPDPPLDPIQPISEVFRTSVSALWITTYNIDLTLFSEFLLSKLGDPPLNVVVLADQRKLGTSLSRLPKARADTLATVNRRWLLRGVQAGLSFHAKTYLAVTPNKRVVLLIGSGNLSSSGIAEGHEVFTKFLSGTPNNDSVISAWLDWMRRIVETVGDVRLGERFRDLLKYMPVLPSSHSPMPLLHNLDRSIGKQFIEIVKEQMEQADSQIDELRLSAPFYDSEANAAAFLINEFKPRRIVVYVSSRTSVDGAKLNKILSKSGAQIEVQFFVPDEFVHAKLVGVTSGQESWLLSGSANLSQAALIRNANEGANIELAVIKKLQPEQLVKTFTPTGMSLVTRGMESLDALSFQADGEKELVTPTVHLISATLLGDGRVQTITNPAPQTGWYLDDLNEHKELTPQSSGQAVTIGSLNGRLVQITDPAGNPLSNRVVVDDPVALADILTTPAGRANGDTPPELLTGDLDTPLGEVLVWLHRNLIMDASERVAKAPVGGIGASEAGNSSDDDLWQRLEREQLVRDPRATTYERMFNRCSPGETDPILELLSILSSRSAKLPSVQTISHSALINLVERRTEKTDQVQPDRHWKISTRIRIRALNLMRRWAVAQGDERLLWVNPLAPAANFAAMSFALAYLWMEQKEDSAGLELQDEDLASIWFLWLHEFVGAGQGEGWLGRLEPSELTNALHRLPNWVSETSAALSWLAVGQTIDRSRILKWQPVLASALRLNILEPTKDSAIYASAVVGTIVTLDDVETRLLKVTEFMDDGLWCKQTQGELGFEGLELEKSAGTSSDLRVFLDVQGVDDPMLDSRLPQLVVATLNYRRSHLLTVRDARRTWRIAFSEGSKLVFLPRMGRLQLESSETTTLTIMEKLARSGGVLASLFSNVRQIKL